MVIIYNRNACRRSLALHMLLPIRMEHSDGNHRTAFSFWDGRVAPVFDTATLIRVVETDSGDIIGDQQETLLDDLPLKKTLRMVELGIGTLICGAVSRPLQTLIAAYGIRVVPFVAGDLEDVVLAWKEGRLEQSGYSMPGCCGRGRRRRTGENATEGRILR
jgi:predicted Fe-Mo cluster-binding NifX family protein